MTDNLPDEPFLDDMQSDEEEDESQPDEAAEIEDADEVDADSLDADLLDADEIEQELLDAMKKLRRTNKKVEEYLDGIARDVNKSAPEQADTPAE